MSEPVPVIPPTLWQTLEARALEYQQDPADWMQRAVSGWLHERPELLPMPLDPGLPFVAYGALKLGELAHAQVATFVTEAAEARIPDHHLRIRDGLPLLVPGASGYAGHVEASLLQFGERSDAAYQAIRRFEPEGHYSWTTVRAAVAVKRGRETAEVKANALIGRSPNSGAVELEANSWLSSADAVLGEGLATAGALARSADGEALTDFFKLQAAYLLLWTVMERYSALVVGPARGPMERLKTLAKGEAFRRAFVGAGVPLGTARAREVVVDSRDPGSKRRIKADGSGAIEFWYQVRSNLTHRGKSAWRDTALLRESLIDLHDVLRLLLLEAMPGLAARWRAVDSELEDGGWLLRRAASLRNTDGQEDGV